jgi:hypothetical protein
MAKVLFSATMSLGGGDDPYKGTPKEGKPFGGGWTGPQFVLTHHAPDAEVPDVTFVSDLEKGSPQPSAARDEPLATRRPMSSSRPAERRTSHS